jgi:hypothetical protein
MCGLRLKKYETHAKGWIKNPTGLNLPSLAIPVCTIIL